VKRLFYSGQGERIRRWLASGKLPVILAVVAIALTLQVVGTGLQSDDYLQREILMHPANWDIKDVSVTGMFSFYNGDPERTKRLMEFGRAPWWTFEEIRLSFFRPLTEITHWLDYHLWPTSPALMHGHSLLWFGIMIFAAAVLYRKIIEPKWVAGFAAFLFAVDNSHGVPVGWIANRNALIATLFGIITLIVHDRWRRDGWKTGAVVGPVCLLLGLLSAEAAIATGAYLVSYEIFLVRGELRKKIIGLFPYGVVTVSWWITYHRLGFGAWGSGFYLDPVQEPMVFIRALGERIPILLFGQWLFHNVAIYGYLPARLASVVWFVVSIILVVIVLLLLPLLKRDKVARFWALGMFLSLLPICTVSPDNRLLLFVGLGGMGLLAQFLSSWFVQAEWLPTSRIWRLPTRIFVFIFVVINCIVAPLTLPDASTTLDRVAERAAKKPLVNLPDEEHIANKTVVFVNPPITYFITSTRFIRAEYGRPLPGHIRILTSGIVHYLDITRVDEHSLELQPEEGFIAIDLDKLYRGSFHPMQVGQRVKFSNMTVEVLSLTEDKRPLRVRFVFPVPLDDPSLLFLKWKEAGYVPFDLPAVGRSVRLSVI
jgi:hypothetical protein